MKDPFHPDRYVRELERLAAAGGWDIRYLRPAERWQRPWLRRGAGAEKKLYISAGIHGDEPAGSLAILETLRAPHFFVDGFDIVLFPMLNPDGLEAGTRANLSGIDLNRDYHNPASAEVAGHLEALRELPRFDATLCLHEDYDAAGVYLYELNFTGGPGCARAILNSMTRFLPLETKTLIDGFPAKDGIIVRAKKHRKRPDWPEALYLSFFHSELIYTCETPSMSPLDRRIQAHVGAIEALVAFLGGASRKVR